MATKRPLVNNAGTLNEIATGDTVLASGFSIPSGASTQFLKADGTADSTTYTVNSEVTRASIRPSLLLDFANSKTLDARITFTRNSTASYYGKDGLLKTAAITSPRFDHNPTTGESLGLLIEEQRTNLLTYSENFNFGGWISVNSTILPNIGISPSGLYNSVKCIATSTNGSHSIYLPSSVTIGNIYIQSVFFKAGEYTKAAISFNSNNGAFTNAQTVFDLITGTVIVSSAETAGIIYVGNGWYRCYASKTALASTVSVIELRAYANSEVFIGDNISGIYIWGAQLEVGAFPTSYLPSTDTFTSRATTGTYIGSNGLIQTAAINTARLNYNPLNLALSPKLLLEPASTNLLTYSEQFDDVSWSKRSGSTIITNSIIAPDGTLTADTHTNTDTVVLGTYIRKYNVFSTDNTNYCVSAFVKRGSQPYVKLVMYSRLDNLNYAAAFYNLDTRLLSITNIGSVTGTTTGMIYYGNGWWRIWCSSNMLTGTNGTGFDITPCDWTAPTAIGSEYGYLWGIQVEQGVYPTSYIPTTSAQVTRAADVSSSAQSTRIADSASITGTNFSNWYRQDEGTFTTKSDSNYSTSSATEQIIYNVSDNSTSNFINSSRINASNRFYGTTNAISQFDLTSGTYTTQSLHSNTYKLNSINTSYNGATVTTDTSAIIPSVNKITLGASTTGNYLNGHISKLAYYPKQLTNAELITLSTV